MQNSALQKIVQQINANYDNKRSHNTVELNKKALDLLNANKTKKANEVDPSEAAGYQKYSSAIYTRLWSKRIKFSRQKQWFRLPKSD